MKNKVFESKGIFCHADFLGSLPGRPDAASVHINCGKRCEQGPRQRTKCLIALGKYTRAEFLGIHFLTHSVDKIVAKYSEMHSSH